MPSIRQRLSLRAHIAALALLTAVVVTLVSAEFFLAASLPFQVTEVIVDGARTEQPVYPKVYRVALGR